MSLFEVGADGLIPYGPLAQGAAEYGQIVEDALWSSLDLVLGEPLLRVRRRPSIAGGSPALIALDVHGAVVVVHTAAEIDRSDLTDCLEYAAWARAASPDELADLYWRGDAEFRADWRAFATNGGPLRTGRPPRLKLITGDFAGRTASTFDFLVESGVPVQVIKATIYQDARGRRLLDVRPQEELGALEPSNGAEAEPDRPAAPMPAVMQAAPGRDTVDLPARDIDRARGESGWSTTTPAALTASVGAMSDPLSDPLGGEILPPLNISTEQLRNDPLGVDQIVGGRVTVVEPGTPEPSDGSYGGSSVVAVRSDAPAREVEQWSSPGSAQSASHAQSASPQPESSEQPIPRFGPSSDQPITRFEHTPGQPAAGLDAAPGQPFVVYGGQAAQPERNGLGSRAAGLPGESAQFLPPAEPAPFVPSAEPAPFVPSAEPAPFVPPAEPAPFVSSPAPAMSRPVEEAEPFVRRSAIDLPPPPARFEPPASPPPFEPSGPFDPPGAFERSGAFELSNTGAFSLPPADRQLLEPAPVSSGPAAQAPFGDPGDPLAAGPFGAPAAAGSSAPFGRPTHQPPPYGQPPGAHTITRTDPSAFGSPTASGPLPGFGRPSRPADSGPRFADAQPVHPAEQSYGHIIDQPPTSAMPSSQTGAHQFPSQGSFSSHPMPSSASPVAHGPGGASNGDQPGVGGSPSNVIPLGGRPPFAPEQSGVSTPWRGPEPPSPPGAPSDFAGPEFRLHAQQQTPYGGDIRGTDELPPFRPVNGAPLSTPPADHRGSNGELPPFRPSGQHVTDSPMDLPRPEFSRPGGLPLADPLPRRLPGGFGGGPIPSGTPPYAMPSQGRPSQARPAHGRPMHGSPPQGIPQGTQPGNGNADRGPQFAGFDPPPADADQSGPDATLDPRMLRVPDAPEWEPQRTNGYSGDNGHGSR